MVNRTCDLCGKEIKSDHDLYDGELRVKAPEHNGRSEFIILIQCMSAFRMQPTSRDICRQCLIGILNDGSGH